MISLHHITVNNVVEFFTVLTNTMEGFDNKLRSWLEEFFTLKGWEFEHYLKKWNEHPDPIVFWKRLSPDRQAAILEWFDTKTVRDHLKV